VEVFISPATVQYTVFWQQSAVVQMTPTKFNEAADNFVLFAVSNIIWYDENDATGTGKTCCKNRPIRAASVECRSLNSQV